MNISKITLSALAVTTLLLTGACARFWEDFGPNNPETQTLSTCYITGDSVRQSHYVYDSQHRLIQIVDTMAYPLVLRSYTYNGNSITGIQYGSSLPPEGQTFGYTLDSTGLAKTGFTYIGGVFDEYGNMPSRIENLTYEYDANGYMTKSINRMEDVYPTPWEPGPIEYLFVHNYTYTEGNLTRDVHFMDLITFQRTITTDYEYHLDKPDTRNLASIKGPYFGKVSKNLIKKATITGDNPSPKIINYTYDYDASGRVIKETQDNGSFTISITNYSYSCSN